MEKSVTSQDEKLRNSLPKIELKKLRRKQGCQSLEELW